MPPHPTPERLSLSPWSQSHGAAWSASSAGAAAVQVSSPVPWAHTGLSQATRRPCLCSVPRLCRDGHMGSCYNTPLSLFISVLESFDVAGGGPPAWLSAFWSGPAVLERWRLSGRTRCLVSCRAFPAQAPSPWHHDAKTLDLGSSHYSLVCRQMMLVNVKKCLLVNGREGIK